MHILNHYPILVLNGNQIMYRPLGDFNKTNLFFTVIFSLKDPELIEKNLDFFVELYLNLAYAEI